MYLVRREREQVDAVALDVERHLARGLCSVDVQQHSPSATQPSHGPDVLHHSGLVVHVHQRDEDAVRAQGVLDLSRLHDSILTRLQVSDFETLALELPAGIEHGRMLGAGGDQVPAPHPVVACRAEQGEVIRLGGAGGPHDLLWRRADECRDLRARPLDSRPCTATRFVADGRRIGEIAVGPAALEHCLDHAQVDRRGRSVVQVDDGIHGARPAQVAGGSPARRRRPCTEVRMPRRMLTSF